MQLANTGRVPRRRSGGGEGYDRGWMSRGEIELGGAGGRTRVGRYQIDTRRKARAERRRRGCVYLRLVHREIRMLRLRTIYAVEYSNRCRADIRLYVARTRTRKRGPVWFVPAALYSRTKTKQMYERHDDPVTSRDKIDLR